MKYGISTDQWRGLGERGAVLYRYPEDISATGLATARKPLLAAKIVTAAIAIGFDSIIGAMVLDTCRALIERGQVLDATLLAIALVAEIAGAALIPVLRRASLFAAIGAVSCSFASAILLELFARAPWLPASALLHCLAFLTTLVAVEAVLIRNPKPQAPAQEPSADVESIEQFIRRSIASGEAAGVEAKVIDGTLVISQRALAAATNVSLTSVSRQLRLLKSSGIIKVNTAGGVTKICLPVQNNE